MKKLASRVWNSISTVEKAKVQEPISKPISFTYPLPERLLNLVFPNPTEVSSLSTPLGNHLRAPISTWLKLSLLTPELRTPRSLCLRPAEMYHSQNTEPNTVILLRKAYIDGPITFIKEIKIKMTDLKF